MKTAKVATGSQDATIAFLRTVVTGSDPSSSVEMFVTHISIVLVCGDCALKLKRAVTLPYVDFSTPDLRWIAAKRELDLNRRTAPALYLEASRVTRNDASGLMIDGDGELVDAVVKMRSFPQSALFASMATAGALTEGLMERLALQIAAFHRQVVPDRTIGGAARISAVLAINEQAFAATDVFSRSRVAEITRRFREKLGELETLLDTRGDDGKIRHCHGDLHLRNICLFEGEPTLFDCLEFDDGLATTDVLYDLAFLLMDLWHRKLDGFANIVLNRYLDARDEEDGLCLMPFLMAVRAAVRAHVTATQAAKANADSEALRDEATSYLDLIAVLLTSHPNRLVAVGGLSGSGKSTVAKAIAPKIGPPPGARILSSDRIRKRHFGVSATTRLPPECYEADVSAIVYSSLADRTESVLGSGWSVVADAVFERKPDRDLIAATASVTNFPFQGIWLEARSDVLVQRVKERINDPSDATTSVVVDQLDRMRPPAEWTKVPSNDGSTAVGKLVEQTLAMKANATF